MVMYLVESTMPYSGEVRFIGKDNIYITADEPHRIVSKFAVEHGFRSYYAAQSEMKKMPGEQKTVIKADV